MKSPFKAMLVLCAMTALSAASQSLTDSQLGEIRFEQKIGSQVSPDLQFRDENGNPVKLRDYFGQKPIVLVPGYYECPMLCTLTFNGMVESMNDMKWSIGNQFAVIHFSINSKETPALASAKKQTYLKRYGRPNAADGWHFLTGEEPTIRKLADEVGFHYAYDASIQQYAHPGGLVVLTPDGRIAKYFFGVKFTANDLYTALQDAADRKLGSPIEKLVLLCFRYSPIHGKYGALIMNVVRVLGIATLGAITWLAVAMFGREKKRAIASPLLQDTREDSTRSGVGVSQEP